jgi:hypothetical protein
LFALSVRICQQISRWYSYTQSSGIDGLIGFPYDPIMYERNSRSRMIRVVAPAAAVLFLAQAVAAIAATAAPSNVLPIPHVLTGNWTAPSGSFSAPSASVLVNHAVTVDLTSASISGTTGYLFKLAPGGDLTITGGMISGPMLGLVQDAVGSSTGGAVRITGTQLAGVRSIVFANGPSAAIDVAFTDVSASGLGDGIHATTNAVDVRGSTLLGGGAPPRSTPAGIHSLDDPAFDVAVPGSHINVFNSTITGYVTSQFQGDSIVGETRVASADIENCVLGHNSDTAGIDSKIGVVTFKNNTVYSDGFRALASHFGSMYAANNIIYVSPATAKKYVPTAYQASGTLVATGDTVVLPTTSYLAQTQIVVGPGSGAPSTYPRIGNITLNAIVDQNGVPVTGPTKQVASNGYQTVLVINP